ncbi:hypothetical protein [Microbispora sp. CA-102843]|uniref:hypothetical protein n=1 Tax=Microbispora sp. CA-102843 TaxID=3239952 RepID=UPI003D8B5236
MSAYEEEMETAGNAKFFRGVGAKGSHNPMHEQDNAPGDASHPGQSLQHADLSYTNMSALRG